ncbi:MAG: transcriptional repressor [Campylobacterales bacterium]|nr:transcriptional repressor [Campylobacterales bacterium]
MKDYSLLLREHDLKATPQRLAILDVICSYGHINIEVLYKEIKKRFSAISLATIYKNINVMTKSSLLFEVKLPNEKSVFEIVKDAHSHLLCKQCGEVKDVKINLDGLQGEITKKNKFQIDQSDLVFSGTCSNCLKL